MRISDWSSDVCSSDLGLAQAALRHARQAQRRVDDQLLVADLYRVGSGALQYREGQSRPDARAEALHHQPVGRFPEKPARCAARARGAVARSEEHTSELQSLIRNSSAVFRLKKNKTNY